MGANFKDASGAHSKPVQAEGNLDADPAALQMLDARLAVNFATAKSRPGCFVEQERLVPMNHARNCTHGNPQGCPKLMAATADLRLYQMYLPEPPPTRPAS